MVVVKNLICLPIIGQRSKFKHNAEEIAAADFGISE